VRRCAQRAAGICPVGFCLLHDLNAIEWNVPPNAVCWTCWFPFLLVSKQFWVLLSNILHHWVRLYAQTGFISYIMCRYCVVCWRWSNRRIWIAFTLNMLFAPPYVIRCVFLHICFENVSYFLWTGRANGVKRLTCRNWANLTFRHRTLQVSTSPVNNVIVTVHLNGVR